MTAAPTPIRTRCARRIYPRLMWLKCVGTCLVVWTLCGTSVSATEVLDEITGTYKVPAARCSTILDNGSLVSCEREVQDCLTIRKQTDDSAWIQFSSTQENAHECSDEGIAKLVDGALLYCPEKLAYEKQCVRIEVGNGGLVMKLINGEGKRDAFCGMRASITGLAFPRSVRGPVGRCNG